MKHPPAGAAFYLSGSTTRRPALTLQNCLVASFPGESWPDGFNDPQVPGELTIAHSLVSEGLKPLAAKSCRVGSPGFSEGSWAPAKDSPAAELADPKLWAELQSRTLDGRERTRCVGAFNPR